MKQTLKYAAAGMLLFLLSTCVRAGETYAVQTNHSGAVQLPHHQNQAARRPDPKIDRMLDVAKAQYEQGRLEAAERSLHRVLGLDPNNQRALYYLGLVARQTWLRTHPGQRRTTPPPEPLPVPAPYPRELLKPNNVTLSPTTAYRQISD